MNPASVFRGQPRRIRRIRRHLDARLELHGRFFELELSVGAVDKLAERAEPYPSLAQMDLLEATVTSPDQLAEYLEALMEKVEETRVPSLTMLRRIQRITAKLPA